MIGDLAEALTAPFGSNRGSRASIAVAEHEARGSQVGRTPVQLLEPAVVLGERVDQGVREAGRRDICRR